MPDIEWLLRWEIRESAEREKEIANMDAEDYAVLLEEIEHR